MGICRASGSPLGVSGGPYGASGGPYGASGGPLWASEDPLGVSEDPLGASESPLGASGGPFGAFEGPLGLLEARVRNSVYASVRVSGSSWRNVLRISLLETRYILAQNCIAIWRHSAQVIA